MVPNLNLNNKSTAIKVAANANQSILANILLAANPFGQKICDAKNKAKLIITPTTAAVIALSGAVSFKLLCDDSINGAPTNIKIKEGKKVKKVTTQAAIMADSNMLSAPING